MMVAFADFDEAIAWLIRGLVEYGWTDITRSQMVPSTSGPGGFDLSFVPESQGRSGVVLRMPAMSGAQRCHEDDTYSFEVKLTQVQGHQGVAVRCAECNYLQEYTFDPDNPMWMAGYIHQSLSDYVPEYVRWRLGGGELSWAQRQGVPPVDGEPCSASLSGWIQQQLSLNRVFDVTMWGGGRAVERAEGTLASGSPIAAIGNYGSKPGSPAATVEDLLSRPGRALTIMVSLGGLAASMAALNVVVTLAVFQLDRMFAVTTSIAFFLVVGSGAVASFFGVRQYKKAHGTILPWVAIVYTALVPICCFVGTPVAIWAALRWRDPRVKTIRAAHS
jgi:hypothetical protein